MLPMRIVLYSAIIISLVLTTSSPAEADGYCFNEAGRYYGISPKLLWAISRVESNHKPQAMNINKNGSIDYCHMQINTFWRETLGDRWDYLSNPCYCTFVGAWVLKQCMVRYGYTWDAVACYNSGKALHELSGERRNLVKRHVSKVIKAVYGE